MVAGLVLPLPPAPGDWLTHRGNNERTGNVDNRPGPTTAKIRWVYKAPENFIASPVPAAGKLFVSGLGAFDAPQFHALALEGDAPGRELWSKGQPLIKLPTVSAPAVKGDLLIFGDGMHQTDGAALYCLDAGTGRPLWQWSLEGKLVHMEGAPVVADDRVFIGGGEAGVLCVALAKATLEGQELDLLELRKRMETRWQELQAIYEKARQTDELAIPPGDDALPKATPKTIWHVKDKGWHVDSGLALAGGKLFLASAYIDVDKVGKRVVAALNAADGALLWETRLDVNPWSGPTIAGDLLLVGCSTIRFDRALANTGEGQIVALESATGHVRWTRQVPGGVLSSVSVVDGLAVFTATDGKVRALNLADGAPRWEYTGGTPFFAGPAVASGVVYAADLKGVLHAINLSDGVKKWTLDVAGDPLVQSPGAVFGSPVVHGKELFLATNNIQTADSARPSVVVCVSDTPAAASVAPVVKVEVDKAAGTVRFPVKMAVRKLPNLKEIYPLEVVVTAPPPFGQKAHETVVTFQVRPSDVHKALQETFGLSPGAPSRSEDAAGSGPELAIFIEVKGLGGTPMRVPLDKAMIDRRTGKPLPPLSWRFTGSVMRQPDPNKPAKVYGADLSGTLIAIFPVTDETVIQSNLTMKEAALLKLDVNRNLLPEEGAEAMMVIEVKR